MVLLQRLQAILDLIKNKLGSLASILNDVLKNPGQWGNDRDKSQGLITIQKHQPQYFRACFLGPERSGKTTILYALMKEMQKHELGDVNIHMDEGLRKKIEKMEKRFDKIGSNLKSNINISAGEVEGIPPTMAEEEYRVSIGTSDASVETSAIQLRVFDYQGEYISLGSDQSNVEQAEGLNWVKSMVKASDILIVTVDAPYLMEKNGNFNAIRNVPDTVSRIIKEAGDFGQNKKLVLFVLTRCEKYLNHDVQAADLLEKVKAQYAPLFKLLEAYEDTVRVAIMPVQTVGFLEFREFGKQSPYGYPTPIFGLTKDWTQEYKPTPRYTDQIFYHIFSLMFSRWVDQVPDAGAEIRDEMKTINADIDGHLLLSAPFEIVQRAW